MRIMCNTCKENQASFKVEKHVGNQTFTVFICGECNRKIQNGKIIQFCVNCGDVVLANPEDAADLEPSLRPGINSLVEGEYYLGAVKKCKLCISFQTIDIKS